MITGICPLDKTSVPDCQMVGDTVQPVHSNTETPSDKHESGTSVNSYGAVVSPVFEMDVYGDGGLYPRKYISLILVQEMGRPRPIHSNHLPCSICYGRRCRFGVGFRVFAEGNFQNRITEKGHKAGFDYREM